MKSDTSLFPGYKHVEAFSEDDDYEEEEEVCYVSLDLGSIDQTLVPSSSSYRLIVCNDTLHITPGANTISGTRYSYSILTDCWYYHEG